MTILAVIYRPLVVECFDPQFLRSVSAASSPTHLLFLALVVLNLIGGFQALGTLMAVGIIPLPAISARFSALDVWADFRRGGLGFWRKPNRPACLLLCELAFRSRHHSHQRCGLSLVDIAGTQRRCRLAARAAPASRSVMCRQGDHHEQTRINYSCRPDLGLAWCPPAQMLPTNSAWRPHSAFLAIW